MIHQSCCNNKAEVKQIFVIVKNKNILLSTRQLKLTKPKVLSKVGAHSTYKSGRKKYLKTKTTLIATQYHTARTMKLEFWSASTTKTTLKRCHQFGSITGLWSRDPIATASFGMTGTTKNELDNVREEFDAAWKRSKFSHTCLAEHMWMT